MPLSILLSELQYIKGVNNIFIIFSKEIRKKALRTAGLPNMFQVAVSLEIGFTHLR